MMCVCRIRDMLNHGTLEHRACFGTLTDQPGQVDRCINTNGCEFLGIINTGSKLLAGNWFKLYAILAFEHNLLWEGFWHTSGTTSLYQGFG